MRNVLIVDTETTGLDPAKDRIIEVGAILYSVKHATVLECMSSLLFSTENPAEHINRIPVAALQEALPGGAFDEFDQLAHRADAVVAHRAEFDRSFIEVNGARILGGQGTPLPWICSKFDIRWPEQTNEGPSLVMLALEHGLGVAYAHRALTDCDLIARLFTRSKELGADLDVMLTMAMRPKAKVIAIVSYEEREQAKKAGFQWDNAKREWWRVMPIEDVSSLPFKCRQVQQQQ